MVVIFGEVKRVSGIYIMKSDRGLLSSGYKTTSKYVPSAENKELILNYFKYNNFQDFNTWQQIARTKLDYDYQELPKQYTCTLTLKWDDRVTPKMHAKASASSKKIAKRKALAQMIDDLICQGFIARGFREDNFIDRLPRRRKHESDESGDQTELQKYEDRERLMSWLEAGNYEEVLNILKERNQKFKLSQVYQSWNYALNNRSLGLLTAVLKALSGTVITVEGRKRGEMGPSAERQFFESSQVKTPLPEDLTDFIRSYQLQKPLKPVTIHEPVFSVRPLPSENVLIKAYTHSPTRQQILEHFHPIQASSVLLQKKELKPLSFLREFQRMQLPCFQRDEVEVSVRLVELLHSLLLFYSQDYAFCLEVLVLLKNELKSLSILFPHNVPYTERESTESYYLTHKNLLTAEFLEVLSLRVSNHDKATSIEGMLIPISGDEHHYLFKPMEPEEIFMRKIKRINLSEFQEAQEISNREMVFLVSKLSGRWVGQVVELAPVMKIHVPSYSEAESEPHPVTLFKLCNTKIFDKTSSALIEASTTCRQLLASNTFLLWQPPSYPQVSVIAELLLEWQNTKQSVLVVTPHPEELFSELTELGFKAIKLTPKMQEKTITKTNLIISSAGPICCDLLRNYAFTRVLVESAQAVSEVAILSAMVKDCRQLWLIGDPFLPKMQISSSYCQAGGMNVSLFERLFREGRSTCTYNSKIEQPVHHSNVLGWANEYVYGNKLNMVDCEQQLPVVKGFPWPSFQYRVCFLHEESFHPRMQYLKRIAEISCLITEQVINSGYTKPQQIGCSTNLLEMLPLLHWSHFRMLQKMGVTDSRFMNKLLARMVRLISGSKYAMAELCVFIVGATTEGLSDIVGALLEGRRGVIIIGDCKRLSAVPEWGSFLGWCQERQLIMTSDLRNDRNRFEC